MIAWVPVAEHRTGSRNTGSWRAGLSPGGGAARIGPSRANRGEGVAMNRGAGVGFRPPVTVRGPAPSIINSRDNLEVLADLAFGLGSGSFSLRISFRNSKG